MITWYVVYTQASQEKMAQNHLRNQGYDVYAPAIAKTRKHARKTDIVSAPLFPRYIFVGLNPETTQWRAINGTRGVSHVLTQNSKPARIATEIIESLKAQENVDGHIPAKALSLFKVGDKISFIRGAFEGISGVIDNFDTQERIEVLFDFLGRMMKATVPMNYVEQSR